MNEEDLPQVIAAALAEHSRKPSKQNFASTSVGEVMMVSDDGTTASVHLDEDDDEVLAEIQTSPGAVAVGDRILVLHHADGSAFAVGAGGTGGGGTGEDHDVEGGEIITYDSGTRIASVLLDNGDTVDVTIIPETAAASAFTPIIFSYPGSLTVNVESPPYYPPAGFTLTQARLSMLATSASNVVVKLRLNGGDADTLTLTAGQITVTSTISEAITTTDYLTVKVTSAGTDAANISVELNL